MEYVPSDLVSLCDRDRSAKPDLWREINDKIYKHTVDYFYHGYKFADIIYDLDWGQDFIKEEVAAARSNAAKRTAVLVRGVVVGNEAVGKDGMRRLQVIDGVRAGGNLDSEKILHLQQVTSFEYTLWAFIHPSMNCSIGNANEIRPGTKVILALTNIAKGSNNNKNLTANVTDVVVDDSPKQVYIDEELKIHKTKDYYQLYNKIRETKVPKKTTASSSSSEGCYIATAVYGSYDCPEVWTLRRFRDFVLAKKCLGRLFIKLYYAVSPLLVKWFGDAKWFQSFWRHHLDEVVAELQRRGFDNTRYTD